MREPDIREQQLIIEARSGSIGAFEQLYRSYNDRIYNFVLQIVSCDHDASDVVQETFIRAWHSLPKLRSDDAFSGWLYRIALNRAKDTLSHRSMLGEVSIDPMHGDGESKEWQIAGREGDPAQRAQDSSLAEAVNKAMVELSPDHRAVVAMHHLEDIEVEDVARMLGVPHGTVLSRLARARAVLKRKLASFVEMY